VWLEERKCGGLDQREKGANALSGALAEGESVGERFDLGWVVQHPVRRTGIRGANVGLKCNWSNLWWGAPRVWILEW
jgi:hypothetical protein